MDVRCPGAGSGQTSGRASFHARSWLACLQEPSVLSATTHPLKVPLLLQVLRCAPWWCHPDLGRSVAKRIIALRRQDSPARWPPDQAGSRDGTLKHTEERPHACVWLCCATGMLALCRHTPPTRLAHAGPGARRPAAHKGGAFEAAGGHLRCPCVLRRPAAAGAGTRAQGCAARCASRQRWTPRVWAMCCAAVTLSDQGWEGHMPSAFPTNPSIGRAS